MEGLMLMIITLVDAVIKKKRPRNRHDAQNTQSHDGTIAEILNSLDSKSTFDDWFNTDDDDEKEERLMNGSQDSQYAFTDSARKQRARFNFSFFKHNKKSPSHRLQWAIFITIGVLAAIVGLTFVLAEFITDVMWYAQLGYQSVIWTQLGAKVGVWVLYAILMAAFGYLSAFLAIKTRPDSAEGSRIRIAGNIVEVTHTISSRVALHIAGVIALVVGAIFGSNFYWHWAQILLMFHAQTFGTVDPQFGIDNGFYIFVLPGLKLFVEAFVLLLLISLIFSIVTHIMMGSIRITMPVNGKGLFTMLSHARRQIAIWLIMLTTAMAVQQLLGMFDVLTQKNSRITGGTYTSIHAGIPGSITLAAVVFIAGIVVSLWLFKSHAMSGDVSLSTRFSVALKAWRTPITVIAAGLVIVIIVGGIYPALLQRFKVAPNAQELESTYIARNIRATKEAYGLTNVKKAVYQATSEGKLGALSKEAESTAQIRLLDPQIIAPTFRQLQQSKQYYTFADTLSVDKYDIDGVSQDTLIAARELDLAGNDNRNWVNDHTVYTHGYGVVAAYGNKVTTDGQPKFMEYGIPTQGKLTQLQHYEPRIYFSPNAPQYSIVGAPAGSKAWEFDYPKGSQGATNTFQGNGGPNVGNWFSRILHAIRFQSDQILFSDRVTSQSQILYDRNPKDRVSKVAPYLTLDGRVYPAVVDGRVKWIVDGYTTSDAYPYSQITDLGSVTKDSTTTTSHSIKGLARQNANYIRNSVKATVDAYDGSVDLYVWDKNDPVIRAWREIFPGHYHDISQISADLMSHLRYPESLFKVQRYLLSRYHVDSAHAFFSGEDFWQTPVDPTESQSAQRQDILQPPYYLTLQTGASKSPIFSLVSTYIPAGKSTREILTGFLSVESDAGHVKGKIAPTYGTLSLQELPKDSNVPGPGQAQNNFNANADVSKELNLLESGSTQVKRGNLLTLPLGGGLVYVEPVYVQSSGSTSFPLLKKVLVAFGDQVGFADTLDEALDQVFGGDSGALAGDAANKGSKEPPVTSGKRGEQSTGDSKQITPSQSRKNPALNQALQKAADAMKQSDQAMKAGDWSAYGRAQQALNEALKEALRISDVRS